MLMKTGRGNRTTRKKMKLRPIYFVQEMVDAERSNGRTSSAVTSSELMKIALFQLIWYFSIVQDRMVNALLKPRVSMVKLT